MKKTIVLLATASALLTGMVSCKKKEMPAPKPAITQTVNVSLNANEDYTFSLPKNLRDDEYEITTQASHYSISEVGKNSSGERIYKYTPATDFTGTDVVVVSNDEEREQHCSPKHHKGPKPPRPPKEQEEDHYIITFNFIIDTSNDASVK
jgi:hypothetical protein